jgi:hypothetical protein
MQSFGDLLDRPGRLLTQTGCQSALDRMAFLPGGLLVLGPLQGLDEVVPVHVIEKDVLALVPTAHDVMDHAWILETEFAGHNKDMAWKVQNVKIQQQAFLRSDPIEEEIQPSGVS